MAWKDENLAKVLVAEAEVIEILEAVLVLEVSNAFSARGECLSEAAESGTLESILSMRRDLSGAGDRRSYHTSSIDDRGREHFPNGCTRNTR